jgi:dolichyl-phosphate-mannose-protein mannosyltransferase
MGVIVLLASISLAAAWWCLAQGYVLYYGDAEAHLNIARRILDSRTPGPEQIGTAWLPLPHVLMLPLAMRDSWWRSGVAGIVPSAVSFVLAGTFLFAAARRIYASGAAGLAVALVFALNPNMLYLQATPMTEPLFAACLAALLWALLWFHDSSSWLALLAAAAAMNAAALTRYEGWFLIPFVCLHVFLATRNKWTALLFAALASLAPLAWLAHNRFYYGDALAFYHGPYSAAAIYQRGLAHGMPSYPGYHDWRAAVHYYLDAARLALGWPVVLMAASGAIVCLWRRIWWPLFLLALPPAFYVWSIHSSGTPIYVPDLWPHSWYNTRYAMAVLPLAAFAGGALVTLLPSRLRVASALALGVVPVAVWNLAGNPQVTWMESKVNSISRRAWTHEAAGFLAAHYRPGDGIISSFGDLTGVLREAGIPLKEGLHEGNGTAWIAAVARPDLFLHEEWALAFSGDEVSEAVQRANRGGPHYRMRKRIIVEGAPVVEIYQRQ